MTEQWRDLGRGTGKRPDGVDDLTPVRYRFGRDEPWNTTMVKDVAWLNCAQYQLLVRTPAERENGYYEVEQYEVGGSGATEWIDEDDYDDGKSGGLTGGRRWVTLHTPAEPDVLREALQAIINNSYVGKAGTAVSRSKWSNYPAHLYHAGKAALAVTEPTKEVM